MIPANFKILSPTTAIGSQPQPKSMSRVPKRELLEAKLGLVTAKGPVNIYGNTGPGNLQRDHPLFWSFS